VAVLTIVLTDRRSCRVRTRSICTGCADDAMAYTQSIRPVAVTGEMGQPAGGGAYTARGGWAGHRNPEPKLKTEPLP